MLRSVVAAVALVMAVAILPTMSGCGGSSNDSNVNAADGGGGTPQPGASEEPTKAMKYEPPTKAEIDEAKKIGQYYAVVETNRGKIELELNGKAAPVHVANFVKLAKAKYYDGLKFHRVVPNFVIQTGDPTGTGGGGPGYTIKAEESPMRHAEGALGMARTADPDSAGSQWYITLSPQPMLDQGRGQPGYVVFGKVVKGMDVVKKIQQGDQMTSVTVFQSRPADAKATKEKASDDSKDGDWTPANETPETAEDSED